LTPHKILRILIAICVMAMLLSACSPQAAENKPVQIIATSAGDIQLAEVFATYDPTLLDSGTPVPNTFPSGLEKIYLGIKFNKQGQDISKFNLNYELNYKGVKLDTEFDSQPTNWKEQASGQDVVIMPVRKKDSTAFADGPYQGKIFINGELIALLNFTVSSATPAP
jgi:hypothetical protein